MERKSLSQVVADHPYADFVNWWPMGRNFVTFMSNAIGSQWQATVRDTGDLATVQRDVATYIELVYHQQAQPTLAEDFLANRERYSWLSGEFDALSYAFYKSAFAAMATNIEDAATLGQARRCFTQQVGRQFYDQVHNYLHLALPQQLSSTADLQQVERALVQVGQFLQQEGYLRDHFAFRFDVDVQHVEKHIVQHREDVVPRLTEGHLVYALYEMGYPAILPSAVYLYQTVGEAQHHSSRTIEELFGRTACLASETADFDPTGYPSDMVVELWEIRPR